MPDQPIVTTLALRSSLLLMSDHDGTTSAADAIVVDLASLAAASRDATRATADARIVAIALARREAHVRVSPARSGELLDDLAASVSRRLTAVVLTGAEIAQDVRDADVGIRRHEMRLRIRAGTVRLIAEIDSASGLLALPSLLRAIDRHSAVALNASALAIDMDLDNVTGLALDHAMWDVAVAARDAALPWIVAAPAASADQRARLATRARQFGASGAGIATEAEARGINALFTPAPEATAAARATVDGSDADSRELKRTIRLLAQIEAIERRERAR
jgi:citrate lyase beta subunit